jgi:hypothetical protein
MLSIRGEDYGFWNLGCEDWNLAQKINTGNKNPQLQLIEIDFN